MHNSDVCAGYVNVEETNEVLDYFNDPEYYLNNALERQGISEVPSKFKEVWTEGGYKYEVRIHPGESKYTDAETIYRVSRQSTELNEFGQGSGKEYLSSDGKWYQESSLKQYYKNGT